MSYIDEYLHYFGPNANRRYADTVFRDLFGDESRKANTLSLYNALNGTSYDNVDDLEITTLSGAIYMGFKNDVSFLIDDEMVLWEHQSTYNPNMPLRGLFYFSELYNRFLATRGLNRFSAKRIMLPAPQYFVFYTGRERRPEREVMRLSDSMSIGGVSLEVTATVLDVHEGSNASIMEACEALAGYAHFIGLVQRTPAAMMTPELVDAAVRQCIADGYLVDYLTERRAEVVNMMLYEWNAEEAIRMIQQEAIEDGLAEGRERGLAEGREQGLAEGREQGLAEGRAEGRAEARTALLGQVSQMISDGLLTIDVATERFGFTEEELKGALGE